MGTPEKRQGAIDEQVHIVEGEVGYKTAEGVECLVMIHGKLLRTVLPTEAMHGLEPNERFQWRVRGNGRIVAEDITPIPPEELTDEEWGGLKVRFQEGLEFLNSFPRDEDGRVLTDKEGVVLWPKETESEGKP